MSKIWDNLPEEMQSNILAEFRSKARRIRNSPWHYFPNIIDFEIKLKDYEPTLLQIGIKKRNKPILSFDKYVNRRMNRYLSWQILRLEKNRSKPHTYWRIAKSLMLRSNTFLAAAITRVMHNWYKNYPLNLVLSTARKVRRIVKENRKDFEFSRVYIPKPGKDKVRPLGVPTMEWRIVLHMWNNFMVWYCLPELSPRQHAFIPTRGTLTAWKDIIRRKVLKHDYVWEMDLKQFFPTVSLLAIKEELTRLKVPWHIISYLDGINRNNPKLPDKLQLDEKKFIIQEYNKVELQRERLNYTYEDNMWEKVSEAGFDVDPIITSQDDERGLTILENHRKLHGWSWAPQFSDEWLIKNGLKPKPWMWAKDMKAIAIRPEFEGIAQGSPTSPFLATVILKDFINQLPCIIYADDPIFYSNHLFSVKDDPKKGIVSNPDKSGWIRYAGVDIKPLTFLGLEYDGTNLKANTRNGSTLVLSEDIKKAILQIESLKDSGVDKLQGTSKGNTWQKIFDSKLAGWIQARLYEGKWNPRVDQDFRVKMVNGSWGDIVRTKVESNTLQLHNTSSYASKSLVNLLRRTNQKANRLPNELKIDWRRNVGRPFKSSRMYNKELIF
jgi:hypothetical protein